MTYQPLTHREWLERIVDTGAQRSGFAADTLRELDEAETAHTVWYDLGSPDDSKEIGGQLERLEALEAFIEQQDETGFSEHPNDPLENLRAGVDQLRADNDQWLEVLSVLEESGLIEHISQPPADIAGLLRMFLPS